MHFETARALARAMRAKMKQSFFGISQNVIFTWKLQRAQSARKCARVKEFFKMDSLYQNENIYELTFFMSPKAEDLARIEDF